MASTLEDPVESSPKEPIVFSVPQMNPDVCLEVFEQAFHVHSAVLVIHSAFFRKFLNTKDKSIKSNGTFRYIYKTKVDEDGTWGLETTQKIAHPTEREIAAAAKIKTANEVSGFENLLYAMYSKPYKLHDLIDLMTLTRLGDFYCALPIVSSSLPSAILNSKGFHEVIGESCREILPISKKLRQPVLFRECMIHVVGSWVDFGKTPFSDKAIDNLVNIAYGRLCEKVVCALMRINRILGQLNYSANNDTMRSQEAILVACNNVNFIGQGSEIEGELRFVRDLYHTNYQNERTQHRIRHALEPLMQNYLAFGKRTPSFGRPDQTELMFLCTEISDEDLPWDLNESDW